MFHRDNHKMVFTGIRRGDLYIVDFTKKAQPKTCLIAKSSKGWLWHRRLAMWACKTLTRSLNEIISLALTMSYLTRTNFVVLVKQGNKLEEVIALRTS